MEGLNGKGEGLPASGAGGIGKPAGAAGAEPGRNNGKASYQRLAGCRLDILPGAQITLAPLGADLALRSEFVGAHGREYILASLPDHPQARQVLAPQAAVTVRFLHPDYNCCGFTTGVAGITAKPLPLLVLDFPDSMGALDLRRRERVNCFLPSRIAGEGGQRKALIANLSEEGCRLVLEPGAPEADRRLAPGTSLACSFRLFDLLDELFVPGLVRYVHEQAGRLCLGMQFNGLDKTDRAKLGDYVSHVLAVAAG
jgi:hypothetical protein